MQKCTFDANIDINKTNAIAIVKNVMNVCETDCLQSAIINAKKTAPTIIVELDCINDPITPMIIPNKIMYFNNGDDFLLREGFMTFIVFVINKTLQKVCHNSKNTNYN
ncbi:MAG: hypothetical protein Q4B68_09170 [Bacteroidales bacterium]|nr:hypothetical protein [Bacteroidales bacterium]